MGASPTPQQHDTPRMNRQTQGRTAIIQVGPANHSLLLSLIFWHDKKKRAPYVRRENWTHKQMNQQRTEWLQQLEQGPRPWPGWRMRRCATRCRRVRRIAQTLRRC